MKESLKEVRILEVVMDVASGCQLFRIHESDPELKIDRIVYREKSRHGWFREISSDQFLERVKKIKTAMAVDASRSDRQTDTSDSDSRCGPVEPIS